jgi:hypothetical protein
MSGRSLTGAMATALAGSGIAPVMFIELNFASGYVRATNLGFDIPWNGFNWLGAGYVGSIDAIVETEEVRSNGITFTLSGIPTALIASALGEQYQSRSANVWFGAVAGEALVASPVLVFPGKMDNMQLVFGDTASIRVTAENRLADFERPRIRRYNHEDQIAQYPADLAFQYVPQMVEKSLYWGVANPPAASAS